MQPNKDVQTLEDLIEVIAQHEDSDTTRMLRTLKGHLSLAANKGANEISLSELAGVRREFRLYLGKKQEEGDFTRNTVRTYVNNFRILLEKARKFGVRCYSPEIQNLWDPIAAGLSPAYGSRDIVRDAVLKGIPPRDYTDEHLKSWGEQMAKNGRHPTYIRQRGNAFRRRLLATGLNGLLPKLSFNVRKQGYGVPLDTFPESLRAQAALVLEWKQAPYVRGRPRRNRCRPISVLGLRHLFCGTVGFAQRILGKTPQTLKDLLSEETISEFARWLLEKRNVDPKTVVHLLQMIPHLGLHPLLKGQDFKWVREIITEIPPPDPNKIKQRKQRKFVRFEVLAKIPDQIIKKAEATTGSRKKAILIRDALLLKFLLILAWRSRNIREARLAGSSEGGNIFKEEIPPMSTMALPESVNKVWKVNPHAAFWQFSFDADKTKSNYPVRAVLPRQLIPLLERYLQNRPALLRPGATDPGTLFLSNYGNPLTAGSLRYYVRGITSRYVGKQPNPHLFRDIHAQSWLASGRRLDDLSNNLWHLDSGFTRRVYGGMFDESFGTQGVEDWLDKKKPFSENDSGDDEE